jgi:hypothetical protein
MRADYTRVFQDAERLIDRVAGQIPALSGYAVNVLYVARRVEGGQPHDTPPAHPDARSW